MLHTNVCKKEGWAEKSAEHVKEKQLAMIKKAYPDYDEKNDFVLWIVPDTYYPFQTEELSCEIEISKKNGEQLDFPFKIRNPYPNKSLYQAALIHDKDKRKNIFGIPLIFHTFAELETVNRVDIKWKVYEKYKNIGWVFGMHMRYNVSFKQNEEHPEYRIITIYSKDYLEISFESDEAAQDILTKYYEEFDTALTAEGTVISYDNEDPFVMIGNITNDKTREYYPVDNIEEEFKAELPDMDSIRTLSDCRETPYNNSYREKTEILIPEYMADIVPESCFGF